MLEGALGITGQSTRQFAESRSAWRVAPLWLAAWGAAALVTLKLPRDPGTLAVAAWILVVGFLCVARPTIGLYLLFGLTLFVEQNDPTDGIPFFNAQIPFFWDISGFSSLAIPVTPAELFLACLLVGWLCRLVRTGRGTRAWQNPLIGPTCLLAATLVLSTAHGFVTGGDVKVALWEIRGPSYMLLMAFLTPGLVERAVQVKMILWILVIGALWAAVEGLWVAGVVMDWEIGRVETLVGHDDAVHLAATLVLLGALLTFGSDRFQRLALLIGSPVLFGVLLATRRRDAIVAVGVGLAVLAALRLRQRPGDVRRFGAVCVVVVVISGLLAVAPIGGDLLNQPIRAVTSAFSPSTARDLASNQYREAERRGLRATIERSPILGIGFGQRYDVPSDVFYIGVPLYQYITHDDLLRFWAKTGTVGFLCYWLFCGAAIVEGTRLYRRLRDSRLQGYAVFAVCLIAMQLVVHSVDMAMTFYRSMILLGVAIGLLLTLERVQSAETSA